MNYSVKYNCFHGSTLEAIDQILQTKEFVFEKRNDHWLGNGVYFFIDDEGKASWWADNAVKKEKGKNPHKKCDPCVIYIEATLEKQELINLNAEADQKILNEFIKYLKRNNVEFEFSNTGNLSKKDKEHYILCQTLDLLSKSNGYKASCYSFPNEERPYLFGGLTSYGIMNNKGNQLCVYDQSILDFKTTSKIS